MTSDKRYVIVLDFDGVILESTHIKAEAYRELFGKFPEFREPILRYQEKNGGLPRRIQIQHVNSSILGRELSGEELDAECERYGELVFQRVMEAPFVAGAREFLEREHARCRLCIASATPEDELRRIVRGRGLTKFFAGVFGAPKRKAETLREIQKREGCEVVFVGDAPSDWEAAKEAGVLFVARSGSSPLLDTAPIKIPDLTDLGRILEDIFR